AAGGGIWFTAVGHGLKVGEIVGFKDLTSHSQMNVSEGAGGWTVIEVSGDRFRVQYSESPKPDSPYYENVEIKWNGFPDKKGCHFRKRVRGQLIVKSSSGTTGTGGLAGNILNWALMSRYDAAVRALIGGKADCDTTNCDLRLLGMERVVKETASLNAQFVIWPARSSVVGPDPRDPDPGTPYPTTSPMHRTNVEASSSPLVDSDMFFTMDSKTVFDGFLKKNQTSNNDPYSMGMKNKKYSSTAYATQPTEVWWFEVKASDLPLSLSITMTVTKSTIAPVLFLYNAGKAPTATASNYVTKATGTTTTGNATLTSTINTAGFYCIEVTTSSYTGSTSKINQSYTLTGNVDLWWPVYPLDNVLPHDGRRTEGLGSVTMAKVRVRVPVAERTALSVIDSTFDDLRYGFMFYNDSHQGKIAVGCEDQPMGGDSSLDQAKARKKRRLVAAIQGKEPDAADIPSAFPTVLQAGTSDSIYKKMYPYSGTPTGPAMNQALKYFTRSGTGLISYFSDGKTGLAGSKTDPWYDDDGKDGVFCRKSFVLLISDGDWNTGGDPVPNVIALRGSASGGDIRTDLAGNQDVRTFTFYSFGDTPGGENAMTWLAMYGAFNDMDEDSCTKNNLPYPATSTTWPALGVTNSLSTFNITQCPACPACDQTCTRNVCCKEWDAKDCNGLPDYFFKVDSGAAMRKALLSALADIVERVSSASAVATVSQQSTDGDQVVRGAFEASDPDDPSMYLWRGHLEVYNPYPDPDDPTGTKYLYDFENKIYQGLLCTEIPASERHCWDAAELLRTQAKRNIYFGTHLTSGQPDIYAKVCNGDCAAETGDCWKLDGAVTTNFNIIRQMFRLRDESGTLLPYGTTEEQTAHDTRAQNLISWVQGTEVAGLRQRDGWPLGDIVYSTPVVVGIPSLGSVITDPDVYAFWDYRNAMITSYQNRLKTTNAVDELHRPKVVYVGANDGMIHAFPMEDFTDSQGNSHSMGEELWAFIPSSIMPELQWLAKTDYGNTNVLGCCRHRSEVDLAPQAWDVFIKPDFKVGGSSSASPQWRTVIVGGQRGGGDVYFAIDVTDPVTPILLWEYSVMKDRIVVDNLRRTDAQVTGNLVGTAANTSYDAYLPYRREYDKLNYMPLSWSDPYVGRLWLPGWPNPSAAGCSSGTVAKFFVGDPSTFDPDNPTAYIKAGTPTMEFNEYLNEDGYYGSIPDVQCDPAGRPRFQRAVAFLSGSMRIFRESEIDGMAYSRDKTAYTPPLTFTDTESKRLKGRLFDPSVLAVDIETGVNLFKYVWPFMVNKERSLTKGSPAVSDSTFPDINIPSTGTGTADGQTRSPYSVASFAAVDVVGGTDSKGVGRADGFVDQVFFGDINGLVWRLITPTSEPALHLSLWKTDRLGESNYYRGYHQPITIKPTIAWGSDADGLHLRLIVGTGKFDDTHQGLPNDRSDLTVQALYNVKLPYYPHKTGIAN
ncbi:MAG: PilC/PilY family type IV pilus protein, partial [Pseudomonadota bacterium]